MCNNFDLQKIYILFAMFHCAPKLRSCYLRVMTTIQPPSCQPVYAGSSHNWMATIEIYHVNSICQDLCCDSYFCPIDVLIGHRNHTPSKFIYFRFLCLKLSIPNLSFHNHFFIKFENVFSIDRRKSVSNILLDFEIKFP